MYKCVMIQMLFQFEVDYTPAHTHCSTSLLFSMLYILQQVYRIETGPKLKISLAVVL